MAFGSGIDCQEPFEWIRSAQAPGFIWSGATPVLLEEEIGDEAGSGEEGENEESREFSGGGKSVSSHAEHEDREGYRSRNKGWNGAKAVNLEPGWFAGVGPEIGFLIVELPGDLQVQFAEQKGQGPSCEEHRRDEIENEDPAPGHGREDGGVEYLVSSFQYVRKGSGWGGLPVRDTDLIVDRSRKGSNRPKKTGNLAVPGSVSVLRLISVLPGAVSR